jgi:predicted  nucleic acid-binding Zn-ribbon protein
MSETFKLFRLQQIDSQIDQMNNRLTEIESILKQDGALQQAKMNVQEAEINPLEFKKILRRAETTLKTQGLKIEQTDAALYSGKVRNPKELEDLNQETAALKRFRSVLEDRLLEAMMEEEEAAGIFENSIEKLAYEQKIADQTSSELTIDKNEILHDKKRLESERKAAASSISAGDLKLYGELRQSRAGIAVAKVTERACSACGTILNSALLHATRSPNQLSRCDTCNRILYGG